MSSSYNVTQTDRNAAAFIIPSDETKKLIQAGKLDDLREVQAFAKHRISAQPEITDEMVSLAKEAFQDRVVSDWGNGVDISILMRCALEAALGRSDEND